MTCIRLGMMCVVLVGAVAFAADQPHEARKLVLKATGSRASLAWTTGLPPPVEPPPSVLGVGGTFEVQSATGQSVTWNLPASGWSANASGTTYRYRNRLAPDGPSPVRGVTLRADTRIKVVARASGIALDDPMQSAVLVRLRVGDEPAGYCARCDTPARDEPGRFVARRCAAPVDCADLVTTTTSSSTSTTSTTLMPECGNDVVDQADEECDGSDAGVCPQEPVMGVTFGCNGPDVSSPCTCCVTPTCVIGVLEPSPFPACCDDGTCHDTSGFGSQRLGVCIPPSCTDSVDCNGFSCDGGTCCAEAGQVCGIIGCCAGSGATCSSVPFNPFVPICCRPAGGACSTYEECCSGSCTASVCD